VLSEILAVCIVLFIFSIMRVYIIFGRPMFVCLSVCLFVSLSLSAFVSYCVFDCCCHLAKLK